MSFQAINPATGETLRTFPMASDAEVATALKTAHDLCVPKTLCELMT
jgi:acyl-CoA reductase-like NAD-dependent aldehyde dehydrogenase